jgi:SAM-dependent methyltransferase
MTITFSFGRNWKSFSRFVTDAQLQEAQEDITAWLSPGEIAGKTVVDVGSGSGIHSYCFNRLGAASLLSIDVDPYSVACTSLFWERSGRPANWQVKQVSVLDEVAMASLGTFEIVYSWGVLHHTGNMWAAIDNASKLAKSRDAKFWLSIYTKGPNYQGDLESKQRFNGSYPLKKQVIIWRYLLKRWRWERGQGKRLKGWFWHGRGMNAYHDAIDWFGGLPYEVASRDEIVAFLVQRRWTLDKAHDVVEGGCSSYLFHR